MPYSALFHALFFSCALAMEPYTGGSNKVVYLSNCVTYLARDGLFGSHGTDLAWLPCESTSPNIKVRHPWHSWIALFCTLSSSSTNREVMSI
ncbi:hypothetical protein DE146DRAFT_425735 [Phaeosphaeria sp. MPI-PUGE-AT-0046c]|nr:hypothetical protein DE146DRAFT_425735 [Phaeosphaeria sp. MPI-PUGE-AT-0046c]